jgi:hypothetical protein
VKEPPGWMHDLPLLPTYLEKHGINDIIIFHIQFVRCLLFTQPLSVKEKANLFHLQTLARAVCLHQLLQLRLALDLEVHNVAILLTRPLESASRLSSESPRGRAQARKKYECAEGKMRQQPQPKRASPRAARSTDVSIPLPLCTIHSSFPASQLHLQPTKAMSVPHRQACCTYRKRRAKQSVVKTASTAHIVALKL